MDCFRWRELDVAPPLESFTTRGHRASARAEIRSGERDLKPTDFVTVDGVRVTTPLRTALDLGCRLSRRDALAAIDALMRAQHLTTGQLVACLPQFAGRRGVVQLRELVPWPTAEPSRRASPGRASRCMTTAFHGLSPTGGCPWRACRRSDSISRIPVRASRSSTTARSSTRHPRTSKPTQTVGRGSNDTDGWSSWSTRTPSPTRPSAHGSRRATGTRGGPPPARATVRAVLRRNSPRTGGATRAYRRRNSTRHRGATRAG